jgi:hypothetical protein
MGASMSYEERGLWVSLTVGVGTYAAYVAIILGRAKDTPLADVSYVATLLWTIGIAIAVNIVGRIAIEIVGGITREITKTPDGTRVDARDKEINRFGEYVGGVVLGVSMIVPLGLALADIDQFWIANAIYAGLVLSSVVSSVLKLIAYRRGL